LGGPRGVGWGVLGARGGWIRGRGGGWVWGEWGT